VDKRIRICFESVTAQTPEVPPPSVSHRQAGRDLAGGGVASGGLRELIPTIARTAVAAGVDGLFMEVHDDPTSSPVDGPTQWPLRNFRRASEQHQHELSPLVEQ